MKASEKRRNALGRYLYGREILKSDKSKSGASIQVKAKDLLENAVTAMASEGHKKCGAPYQFWLAVAYLQGLGVEKDAHKAFIWLERSAKNDFLPAQGWLGQTLVMGAWTPRDCKRGLGLLTQNSAARFELSTNMLGYAYEYGFCVENSQHTTVKFYKQAIKSNLKTAYYNLGMSYVNSEGVPQNIAKGFSLLDKAAIRGYLPAARISRVVGEYMIAKRIIDNPIKNPSNQRNVLNKQRALSLLTDAANAGFQPAKS